MKKSELREMIREELLNEEKMKYISQKTRWGTLKLGYVEEPTAPGYPPNIIIEVELGNQELADIMVTGDPRVKNSKANVKVNQLYKAIKLTGK